MDADHEEIIRQRLSRNGPGGQLWRADNWRECYGEDVAYLLDQLAQERRARHYAEQIATDLYRDLAEGQEAVVAAAEERERNAAWLSELARDREQFINLAPIGSRYREEQMAMRNAYAAAAEGLRSPESPPPAGALAARLAEALAALEPFAALAEALGALEPFAELAEGFSATQHLGDTIIIGPPPEMAEVLRVSHLRRARAILDRHQQEKQT